jgi:hypothetical protein
MYLRVNDKQAKTLAQNDFPRGVKFDLRRSDQWIRRESAGAKRRCGVLGQSTHLSDHGWNVAFCREMSLSRVENGKRSQKFPSFTPR